MSRGIVVDHKESGVRYAVSESNFDKNTEEFVRELGVGETVLGFTPLARVSLGTRVEGTSLELPVTPDPKDVPNTTPTESAGTSSTADNK